MKKCPHVLYVKQLSKGVSIPPLLNFLAFWPVVFEIHPTGLSEHRVDRTRRKQHKGNYKSVPYDQQKSSLHFKVRLKKRKPNKSKFGSFGQATLLLHSPMP